MSKKQSEIRIVDAKGGYRVKFVGANGEPLMNSEVLESVSAVHKNISASIRCGDKTLPNIQTGTKFIYAYYHVVDYTKKSAFVRYGAIPHSKPKTGKK